MRTLLLLTVPLGFALGCGARQDADPLFREAGTIGRLPDPEGLAGVYAGVGGEALLVAGGANFPNGKPWEGGTKVWSDRVYAVSESGVRPVGVLPRPLGYGVSVTWEYSAWCFGGSNATGHHADGYCLMLIKGQLYTSLLSPLPKPCANMTWAVVGSTLHVVGGIETPDATTCLNTHWALDLRSRSEKWRELPPCPGKPRMLAVGGSDGTAFYLLSGAALSADADGKPKREYLTDGWKYTPGGAWERVADLPRAAVAAPSPAPYYHGRLYVLGGDDGTRVGFQPPEQHPGFPRTAFAYDPTTDRWREVAGSPISKVCVPAVELNGRFIFPGGEPRPGFRDRAIGHITPVLVR